MDMTHDQTSPLSWRVSALAYMLMCTFGCADQRYASNQMTAGGVGLVFAGQEETSIEPKQTT